MKKIYLSVFLIAMSLTYMPLQASTRSEMKDTATVQQPKKTFWRTITAPARWIGRNWNAYDPKYSTPSFYNWSVQLQDNFTKEWLNMKQTDVMEIKMHSNLSSKIGPYFAYRWLSLGYSFDISAMKGSNGKTETGFDFNSNLLNFQFIYRRTGGDFSISKMTTRSIDSETKKFYEKDVTDLAKSYDIGDRIKYSVTGANLNFFLNHKKYSNPAATSGDAIQLRSVGSPIVGFGFQRQRITTTVSDLMEGYVFQNVLTELSANPSAMGGMIYEFNQKNGTNFSLDATGAQGIMDYVEEQNVSEADDSPAKYRNAIGSIIQNKAVNNILFDSNKPYLNILVNQIPSTMNIDDYHLQLGYAYNLVFSRRLLLGLSLIASPGIKNVTMDNDYNMTNYCADEFAAAANQYTASLLGKTVDELTDEQKVAPSFFRSNVSRTQLGYDIFGRANLTFNYKRWRAGVNLNVNAFVYHSSDANIQSIYGNANVYLAYCFGKRKRYRWDGKDRQAYVMAALTKKEISEMNDTSTVGNIANNQEPSSAGSKNTLYISDNIGFTIDGCDLVQGPDGTFGSYVIDDGYITPGQDSEGRLKVGTVIPVDKNGRMKITCGHKRSFRAASWWKNQLDARQTPNNWYPEMLHYALKGTLTLWVRSFRFGTTQPVKLVIKDFCVNHGKETHSFTQIASKNFYSHSAYSIVGNVAIYRHKMRVYIESRDNGKRNTLYIWTNKASYLDWMKNVPDDRPISQLSILGAHNAGSASLPEKFLTSTVHAQNLSLQEQMEDGIRAFDIRLKKNMNFGRLLECREGMPETLDSMRSFLKKHPSEVMIALIGSDEGGTKWPEEMQQNYRKMMSKYQDILVDSFSPSTPLGEVRGKILVLRRQKECPYGKLVVFEDNCSFNYEGFYIEDTYREHKTYKKIKLVEKHIREANENTDPNRWYWTFTNIKWNWRHHRPYYSAWGGKFLRKPMNPSVRDFIEDKNYTHYGIVFADFYNNHCDYPQLTETIINSNFNTAAEEDFVPVGK